MSFAKFLAKESENYNSPSASVPNLERHLQSPANTKHHTLTTDGAPVWNSQSIEHLIMADLAPLALILPLVTTFFVYQEKFMEQIRQTTDNSTVTSSSHYRSQHIADDASTMWAAATDAICGSGYGTCDFVRVVSWNPDEDDIEEVSSGSTQSFV